MKRILALLAALLGTLSLPAQEIGPAETSFADYRTLLEAAGYEAFAFDLRPLLDDDRRYDITLLVKEYADGKEIGTPYRRAVGSNRLLVSDFPAESRARIPEDELADPERGVYQQAERLVVGRYPSGVDSVAQWVFAIPELGRFSSRLTLRGIAVPELEKPMYNYCTRPFRLERATLGRFVPLVFFGSMWYDARAGICRFCGEKEIAPDLSSEIVAHVPHFYVIGVRITERKK